MTTIFYADGRLNSDRAIAMNCASWNSYSKDGTKQLYRDENMVIVASGAIPSMQCKDVTVHRIKKLVRGLLDSKTKSSNRLSKKIQIDLNLENSGYLILVHNGCYIFRGSKDSNIKFCGLDGQHFTGTGAVFARIMYNLIETVPTSEEIKNIFRYCASRDTQTSIKFDWAECRTLKPVSIKVLGEEDEPIDN